MPLNEFFLVNPQVLHELLVLDLLPPLMVSLDLILHFLDTVALISVLLEFFPPKVVAVKELLLEESYRFIIIFKTL